MLKSAATLGMLGVTLVATPAPQPAEVMNFRFSATEFGCLTRGLRAMQGDAGIEIKPDLSRPGPGLVLSVDRRAFQKLIKEMMVTNRTCIEQVAYLLTPEDASIDPAQFLKGGQRPQESQSWLPFNMTWR